jgi:hypothetical protein
MKKTNLFAYFLFISISCFAQTYTTGVVNLSSTAGLTMTAKLDVGANVTLTLTGPAGRWFALGFDASSMASGTDVVGVHAAGVLTNFDAYLTGYAAPVTDALQNWTITSDQVAIGIRTIIATRALNTGDPNDHVFSAAPGTLSLIWARGNTASFAYAYHGNTNRGIASANFTLVAATPAPTGASPQTMCAGNTLSQLSVSGSTIVWYTAAVGGTILSANTVLVNGTTYYASQTINGVESQNRLAVTVTLQNSPTPPVFVSPQTSFCFSQNPIIYTLDAIPNATSYTWSLPLGLSGNSQQNNISVLVNQNFTTGVINVVANNSCGQSAMSSVSVVVHPSFNVQNVATACASFQWNGQLLTTSGNYTYQGITQLGCDSTVNLQLTILNNSQTNLSVGQCTPFTLNGQTYTQSGNYQQILPSTLGCDSVVNVLFTLFQTDTVAASISGCDSVILGGQVFINSGVVPQYLTSVNGCDSLILWNVTINNSSYSFYDTTVTSLFTWNNQTYTATGTYTQQFTTVNGCDSIVSVDLTVMTSGLYEFTQISPFPSILCSGDYLNIPADSWELVDLKGTLLKKIGIEINQLEIDLPSGIYYMRNSRSLFKFIVL